MPPEPAPSRLRTRASPGLLVSARWAVRRSLSRASLMVAAAIALDPPHHPRRLGLNGRGRRARLAAASKRSKPAFAPVYARPCGAPRASLVRYLVSGKRRSAIKRIRGHPGIGSTVKFDGARRALRVRDCGPSQTTLLADSASLLVGSSPVTHSKETAVAAPAVRLLDRCSASPSPPKWWHRF